MKKQRLFAILAVFLMAIGAAIGTAAQAQAVSDNDINTSSAHSTAYRVGDGQDMRFYGSLQAKSGCLQMQYKTPQGNWTTGGFWESENTAQHPLTHCANYVNDYQVWSIHWGVNVRGIRATDGVRTLLHCDTATECRAMAAP